MELVLPKLARHHSRAAAIRQNAYVLAGRGDDHVDGFSEAKRAFDEKLAAELPDVPQWQIARSATNGAQPHEPH